MDQPDSSNARGPSNLPWLAGFKADLLATAAAGRRPSQDELLELLRRHTAGTGFPVPTSEELAALIEGCRGDVEQMVAGLEATLPGGRDAPAFGRELAKRAWEIAAVRLRDSGGTSA